MKAYTDIEQSQKLAEILPLESADMCYPLPYEDGDKPLLRQGGFGSIPCWSLAALLNVLPFPILSKDKLGSGKEGWMVSAYPDNCRYDSCWHDNPIDACYEMIIKLQEFKNK